MEAILSCKLFRSSTRQAAIKAALEDPVNQELVLQLKKYIDQESISTLDESEDAAATDVEVVDEMAVSEEEDTAADVVEDEESEATDTEVVDDTSTEADTSTEGDAASTDDQTSGKVVKVASISKTSDSSDDKDTDEDAADSGDDSEPSDDADDPAAEEDVSSSYAANMSSVTASHLLASGSLSLDTIQGQLNATEDTAGVVRIKQSNNELWIYFNDKKNLNNVMEAVIDHLNAAGFYQLEFNRLARTDNAIVFEIMNTSTEVGNGETKKA